MNWKLIIAGGVAFYAVTFVVSMATGPLIHEGLLEEPYEAHESFWRPELAQDPPDIAALMPRWVTLGLLGAFLLAGVYGWIGSSFTGPPWKKGMKFGFMLFLVSVTINAGWSGVFNLADEIWIWWSVEGLLYYLPAGAVLGVVAEKLE